MRRPLLLSATLFATACGASWSPVDDVPDAGSLSGIWGTGPDDIFVVGGDDTQGTVLHHDGTTWSLMEVPDIDLLVWVYGFGPDDVYAVGEGGGMLHYDGDTWSRIETGTTEDLWGIFGTSADDIWIVGGTATSVGDPVLMHYDGTTFDMVPLDASQNPNRARSLFKVWGVGSKLFAVGSKGWILSYDGTTWTPENTGAAADDDFVALWGSSEDEILAVGGRSNGQISLYDGTSWTTTKPRRTGDVPVPGLNAVYMDEAGTAVLGGLNGWVGSYTPAANTFVDEGFQSNVIVHAAWGDGTGATWTVGGTFVAPHAGEILVRR